MVIVGEQEEGDTPQENINLVEDYYDKNDFRPRSMQEERQEAVKALPVAVKRRISALKKATKDYMEEDAKLDREIHGLVCKMHERLEPLYNREEGLILGSVIPEDKDLCPEDIEDGLGGTHPAEEIPGIPKFWLTVLKSNSVTSDLIHPYDEPILAHITNAKVVYSNAEDSPGYTIEFYFSPNKYFTNEKLTRTYIMKYQIDEKMPFAFNGPEVDRSIGCSINWNEGMDVTSKLVKKKQKHRQGHMTRVLTTNLRVPSIFNYFSYKGHREFDEDDDDDDEAYDEDNSIGLFMKDKMIPLAVLYYIGEGDDSESDLSDENDFSSVDDEDDDENNEEEESGDCPKVRVSELVDEE